MSPLELPSFDHPATAAEGGPAGKVGGKVGRPAAGERLRPSLEGPAGMLKVAFAIGEYPAGERQRRIDAVHACSTTEITVGAVAAATRPFDHDLSPLSVAAAVPAYVEAFRAAEDEGYHAVIPFGVWDIAVEPGRCAVDIPVIGACQAMLHTAALIGERFGLVAYHAAQVPQLRAMIRGYGMEGMIAGIRTTGLTLAEITGEQEAVAERFLRAGRALVTEDGCDVVLAFGITQCPLVVSAAAAEGDIGVPVVDGIGAVARFAGLLAALGLKQSRVRWPLSPTHR